MVKQLLDLMVAELAVVVHGWCVRSKAAELLIGVYFVDMG